MYALSLSGAGTNLYVHLGVLKALAERNYPIAEVLGVSGGALVGALWAAYQDYDKIEKIIVDQDMRKYFRWGWFKRLGIYNPEQVAHFIDNELQLNWNNLQLPFTCAATAVESGESLIFSTKTSTNPISLGKALQASMTIPVVFQSMTIRNPKPDPLHPDFVHLVDGGVSQNLLNNTDLPLIASYLGYQGVRSTPCGEGFPGDWDNYLMNLFGVMQYRLLKHALADAEIIIDHPYTWDRDFVKPKPEREIRELIDLGYRQARDLLVSYEYNRKV